LYIKNVLNFGKSFGLSVPVLPGDAVTDAIKFVQLVDQSSLHDFEELQKRAKRDNTEETMGDSGKSKSSNIAVEKDISGGYCLREFKRFLKEKDPHDVWCGLSAKVTDDGYVFFACKECCNKK